MLTLTLSVERDFYANGIQGFVVVTKSYDCLSISWDDDIYIKEEE